MICIFCLRAPGSPPWCTANPGRGCTYGFACEYPLEETAQKPAPTHVRDAKLCVKCGLHPKNPMSATNGCVHEYQG